MKNSKLFVCLLLCFIPIICLAQSGDTTHMGIIWVFVLLLIWGIVPLIVWVKITSLVYKSSPSISNGKRLRRAVLFFFSPALIVLLWYLWSIAWGEISVTETTNKPLTIVNAVFPPGTHIEYMRSGGFFGWHAQRTYKSIDSPHPVMLGKIRINGLWFYPDSDEVGLLLDGDQFIDGYYCAADRPAIIVSSSTGKIMTNLCALSTPK